MKKLIRLIIKLISFLIGIVTAVLFGYRLVRNYRKNRREKEELLQVEEANFKAIEKISHPQKRVEPNINLSETKGLSSRQKRVYDIIKQNKKVEMRNLLGRISGVTERTLRRDLLKLQSLGLVVKLGNTKSVTYLLKENE